VLSIALARALHDAGLQWKPARGDTFVMPDREMDSDVFVLSDMTIEVHEFPGGPVIGFNGTTEWALDSVDQHDALWIPAEHQLRELLGAAFVRLEKYDNAHRVVISLEGVETSVTAPTVADAYGLAVLDALRVFPDANLASELAE